jgi:hypothetical protein
MWRDPRESWVSPLGLVVQVGDSAHTFLPSSGNGATQAMEDAISLATCLQIAGKSNIKWATMIHNKLRYRNTHDIACAATDSDSVDSTECRAFSSWVLSIINARIIRTSKWSAPTDSLLKAPLASGLFTIRKRMHTPIMAVFSSTCFRVHRMKTPISHQDTAISHGRSKRFLKSSSRANHCGSRAIGLKPNANAIPDHL